MRYRRKRSRRQVSTHEERGLASSFYLLCLLPLLFLLGGAGADLAGWSAVRDRLQLDADSRALYAAAYLPDIAAAESYLRSSGESDSSRGVTFEIAFPPPSGAAISVTGTARYNPLFLGKLIPTERVTFKATRTAVASQQPIDLMLVLPDGASLSPLRTRSSTDSTLTNVAPNRAWGDSDRWPASGYFGCGLGPHFTHESHGGPPPGRRLTPSGGLAGARGRSVPLWAAHWDEPEFQRALTQGCFNPVLSAVKLGALGLTDSLRPFPDVRIALAFAPGAPHPADIQPVRTLIRSPASKARPFGIPGGFFGTGGAEVAWPSTVDPDLLLGDGSCALFSEPESTRENRFALPPSAFSSSTGAESGAQVDANPCGTAFDGPVCGRPYSPGGFISDCFRTHRLTLRHAIYWHAVQRDDTRRARLVSILHRAITEFAARVEPDERQTASLRRGRLAELARKELILVVDRLVFGGPDHEVQELMTRMFRDGIHLSIMLFSHEGLTNEEIAEGAGTLNRIGAIARSIDPDRTWHELNYYESANPLREGVLERAVTARMKTILRR